MFSGLYSQTMPDAHAQATQALEEESRYRFASFSASDAVTLVRETSLDLCAPLHAALAQSC